MFFIWRVAPRRVASCARWRQGGSARFPIPLTRGNHRRSLCAIGSHKKDIKLYRHRKWFPLSISISLFFFLRFFFFKSSFCRACYLCDAPRQASLRIVRLFSSDFSSAEPRHTHTTITTGRRSRRRRRRPWARAYLFMYSSKNYRPPDRVRLYSFSWPRNVIACARYH